VALPDKLFFNTGIPACLWFLSKNRHGNGHRDRHGEVLFIDARNMGEMITRAHRQLTSDDIERISSLYNKWRSRTEYMDYKDVPGFCKATTTQEIAESDFILTPGRYVGLDRSIDLDSETIEKKINHLKEELLHSFEIERQLKEQIRDSLQERQ